MICMDFETFIKDYLTKNGMFESQADEVFELIKKDKANESMADRWNDSVDHYPESMRAAFIFIAKKTGLKYLNENLPHAWFKWMFEE